MYAGAVFIQLALQWNIYLAVVLLLSVTALYTVAGDRSPFPRHFKNLLLRDWKSLAIRVLLITWCVCHWLLCGVPQVVWLQLSTQTLLKLLSCWQDLSPSWASVSQI